ncbi:unnamed protein product [Arctia plantaginis]|uniref:Cyclic nucleotide-binding domain-containing protein n=1 Tax=Arctia plantaginis TaxID=874455 RepID=A0A8S1AJX2_ARCPL|nr:unnamed protein product [Arctia plantaginis]
MSDSKPSSSSGSSKAFGRTRAVLKSDLNLNLFSRHTEAAYPPWWTNKGFLNWFRNLPEDTLWNCYICVLVLVELGRVAANPTCGWFVNTIELFLNISYAVHVLAIGYRLGTELEDSDYVLWNFGSLNDYNLKGSVLGTTLKYCYIFMVLRITWAWIWLHINMLQEEFSPLPRPVRRKGVQIVSKDSNESDASKLISSLYIVNKMFIPIGMPVPPQNDIERITCLLVIISGCIVVTGAAVASLSLVISLYMSPEETFRSRYKLIIEDMKDSHVPDSLRAKVQKFYRMYWHKQRAVSATKLLPTFPPTLPATVNLDIYFEATQKSRILRDLSYQFLSELAKRVETIHYIPGDAIIKRNERKSAFIYITYGDIEMLTAEDDVTAILRFTRGTVLNPCGGAVAAAACKSHLRVRAATFCTAHVLNAADLWRVVLKYSAHQNHGKPINSAFKEHINRVKRHYAMKIPREAVHKSSILHFNRNLLALKEMKDAKGNSLLANPDVFLEIANCYIMRNIYPYNLVYKKEVDLSFTFFEYINTLIFVVDHIVRLSTGAHVEEGVPITFAQTSSQQMRSKWFVLDLVGTLPIFEIIGDGHFGGINKILRLPKVFRVLNVIEEKCVYHRNLLRFCSYTLLLLIACYLIAAMQQAFMCFQSGYCLVTNFTHSPYWEKKELDEETVPARITFGLYWAISMIMFTTHIETWGKDDMSNVMYTIIIIEVCIVLRTFMEAVYSATIMVTTALREDYDARIATVKHFLIRNDVDPELRKRFITYLQLCWYTDKAYKMTHKQNASIFYDLPGHVYQDIVGRHRLKYVLSIRLLKLTTRAIFPGVKYPTRHAPVSRPAPYWVYAEEEEGLHAMNTFLVCVKQLPLNRTRTGDVTGALQTLSSLITPPPLLPLSYMLKTEELTILASHAHLFYTSPNEILMNTGDLVNEIYVIVKGICEVISPKTRNTICHLTANHHFGVAMCLLRLPAYYTVRAVTHVQIFCISKRHLKPVFENPQIKEALEYVKTTPRMLVGYYNEDGILIYHPSSTAAYYMKGPFITDLFGCLPLEKLEAETVHFDANMYQVTPVEQFLMMNRLVQLYRFPCIMQSLRNYIERRDILMVINAVPLFISMFNILTCLMIFNSVKIFFFKNDYGITGWLLEPFKDPGGSWIDHFSSTFRFNLISSPFNLYLATHFWVVYETTTTGYGKFKPSNQALMQILFLGMTMCGMIITYFSVRIISIRSNVNKAHAGFQQHMRDIIAYMKKENLDPELQKELRLYYEYNWEKMGGIDYRGVLKLCEQLTLRSDAILHIYGPTFAKCPLLAQCDISLLRMIGRSVRSVYFLRDMKIIEYDDVVNSVYFVDYGGVESRVSIGIMSQAVRLPRGSLFGNLEAMPAQRVPMTIVATSRLHLLKINSQAFYQIINEFPTTKALLELARMTDNQHYILGNIEDFKVKLDRGRDTITPPPPTTRRDIIKYIYFQEGLVLLYLILVSLICIFMDLYNAGYQDNRAWLILTLYILDMCFFLKILMQFALPLLVTKRRFKTLLLPLRRMYFKREFKYDMMSCVPIELFAFHVEENRWLWFSWLRINRMFRIVTVNKCLKRRNERITVNLIASTILTVTIWFSLFVHASTCIWYFIGRLEEQKEYKSSWIYTDEGLSWCRNEYICSLYFVITTFTQNGVGDIMPKKQSEVIFVTILMIISTLVFMMYVGEFSKLIQYQSFRSFSFYSQYLELQVMA